MRRVIIESPYRADTPEGIAKHEAYARAAMLDCLRRGEAPYASHLLYTQVLDDATPEEREAGISAGLAWQIAASYVVVYADLGISEGMRRAIDLALGRGILVVTRYLEGWA